jgi:hypothetical protein
MTKRDSVGMDLDGHGHPVQRPLTRSSVLGKAYDARDTPRPPSQNQISSLQPIQSFHFPTEFTLLFLGNPKSKNQTWNG